MLVPIICLEADPPTLLSHIAARWAIEVLFEDGKEELGLDTVNYRDPNSLTEYNICLKAS